MPILIKNNLIISFFMILSCGHVFAEKSKLDGFNQLVQAIDGRSEKRLYKLKGQTFKLTYKQAGDFQLTLSPESPFEIIKSDQNIFQVKLVSPKDLWHVNEKKPFKIKWFIKELME